MIGELAPTPVDPATAGGEYWKRHHEFRRVRQHEMRPDDPLRPDHVEEQTLKRDDPFQIVNRFEISRGETMLSCFGGQTVRPGTPEYASNRHLYSADIYVRPDERRHGIGSSWLPVLLELMDRHGCTVVSMWSEQQAGHEFMRWLGAEGKFNGAENRLDLTHVDWAMVRRWVDEGARRSPEARLESYDGPLPESMWEDYAPQLQRILNTIPFEDLDHGEIVITADHLREFYDRMQANQEVEHTILTREPDGTISGITDCRWAPYRATIVHQGFTGVRPEARGRGIGKWIKAAMLLHLRDLYPEARWVTTDNAGSNVPMLAINEQLGFRRYRAGTEYQITRDRLAEKVRTLGR